MAAERVNERGFTLLEVMVALAILGLALSAILSAQAGMYDANVKARNMTIGVDAARCRMSELEEKLLKDGYPEIDDEDDGPCCDEESPKGFSCRWKIERVTLPDPPAPQLGADGGVGGSDSGSGGGGLGGLGALASAAGNPSSLGDGGIGGLSSMLSAGAGPNGQAGVMGIAGMAMSIVYPQLKPLLEASIRRVTVEVVWHEGPNERTVKIVQFVTSPQRGLPPTVTSADPGLTGGPPPPGGTTAGPLTPGLPVQPGMFGGGSQVPQK